MKNWDVKKLRDLADIRVSNVDKKIYPSERPVKLCNYMDVYTNEYIDGSIQFMEGSANDAEIERFGLNIGDVIITKDSETPDDIGIPTVIHEQIDNLVCGYHLALIRPDNEKIDSIFLSKYLSTSRVANYFALHASGSTRFGLPIGAIESVEILTPPKQEQTQIATILSTIDRAIEQTEALIAKQQRIKTGLMQDLLTKGIDENGNIRSEETHEFKDSPLGRIPVEWEVISIGEKARVRSGSTPSRSNDKFWIDGTVPWVKTSEVCFSKITETEEKITEEALKLTSLHLEPINSILVAMYGQGGTRGRCAILGIEATMNQACAAILGKQGEINQEYLFYYLSFQYNELRTIGHGSNQTNLNGNLLRAFFIKLPSYKEQVIIAYSFNQLKQRQDQLTSELSKFNSLKKGLMQDLLTGKVRVTDLLNQKTATN